MRAIHRRSLLVASLLACSPVLSSWRCKVIFLSKGTIPDEHTHRGLANWCTNNIGAFVTLGGHTQIYGNSDASSILRLTFHTPSKMSKQEIERHEARIAQQEALIEKCRQEGTLYELERRVMRFVQIIQDLTRSDFGGIRARAHCFFIDAPLPMVQFYFDEFKRAVAYYAINKDGSAKIRLSKRDEYHLAFLAEWLIGKGFGQEAANRFCAQAVESNKPGFGYLAAPDQYASAGHRFFEWIVDTVVLNCASYLPDKIMKNDFNQLVIRVENTADALVCKQLMNEINRLADQ